MITVSQTAPASTTNDSKPGPTYSFSAIRNVLKVQRDIIGFFDEMATYGDVACYRFGPYRSYQFNHPDLIREVLVTHADRFVRWKVQKRAVGKTIGNGTFNADGDFWKRQRKLVQPAFHLRRIQGYADLIAEQVNGLIDGWQERKTYDMAFEMLKVTMSTIAQIIFGSDVKGHEETIHHALRVCLVAETREMTALIPAPDWLPLLGKFAFRQAVKTFDEMIYGFIRARRTSGVDTGDILAMLLAASDEDNGARMTDQQVRDEALTLFMAGYETGAIALSWTLMLLGQHPEIEQKLAEEVTRVVGQRPVGLADLRQLPYPDMVLKEAMRLYPPAFALIREASEDVTIGGYRLVKGDLAIVSQHVMHRDARFFDQPDKFIPERFAPGYEERLPRYAYFPFGGGPRVCTGQALATMEAQIVLATIAQRCRLSLVPGQTFTPAIATLQRPRNGVQMMFKPHQ